jgi:hypothetical protein
MDNTEQKPTLFPIHNYRLENHPQLKEIKMLVKDGLPCKCHRVAPTLIPSQLGSLSLQYENCTTNCTRAILVTDGDRTFLVQTCEAQQQKFLIENAEVK